MRKNPLAVLFGHALRTIRGATLSSADMARSLEMSKSGYRLVESGNAVLQPTYAHQLIKTLPKLVWSRAIAYLVCAQVADSAVSKSEERFWEIAKSAAAHEEELNKLITSVCQIWSTKHSLTDYEGEAETTAAVDLIRRYLQTEHFYRSSRPHKPVATDLVEWAEYAPNDVSPLQLEMLLQQIEISQYFPPSVPPRKFADWETNNQHAFINIYAFVSSLEDLAANAKNFHWEYLDLKNFGHVHILTSKNPKLAHHREMLERGIAETKPSSERARRIIVDNLRIREVDGAARTNLLAALRYDHDLGRLLRPDDVPIRAVPLVNAWLYRLRRYDLTIGFADSGQGTDDFVSIALNKGEVNRLKPVLIDSWKRQA